MGNLHYYLMFDFVVLLACVLVYFIGKLTLWTINRGAKKYT